MGLLARIRRFLTGTGATAQAVGRECCKRGHQFTDATTYWRPDGRGRECRVCRREAGARRRASSSSMPQSGHDTKEG